MNAEYCMTHFGEKLGALRSAFHKIPELGMEEYKTTALIRSELERIGLEILDLGLKTGVVALLRGGRPGNTVALRADIDALPVTEETGSPDASETPGLMHACGHDVHITGLLGAAMLLLERKADIQGNVLFVFQPAEEPIIGAQAILDTGIFEKADVKATFGLHVWPTMNLGEIGLHEGVIMAAKDSFRITVRGVGGHGSSPHTTCDPIVAGSAIVCAIQTIISRNIEPFEAAVVSICQVNAGTCDNVIPEEYTMLGSMRTFSEATRTHILQRLEELAADTARAYGCTAEFQHLPSVPAVCNAAELSDIALRSAVNTGGEQAAKDAPAVTGSEDFALYPSPSYFYRLGVLAPGAEVYGLHNSHFYPDPRSVCHGAALLANSALLACEKFADS